MKFKIIHQNEQHQKHHGRATCSLKPQKHRFIKKTKKQLQNACDLYQKGQISKAQPKTSSMQSLLKPDYSNFVVFDREEKGKDQHIGEQPQKSLSKQARQKMAESLIKKYSQNSNFDFVEFSEFTHFSSDFEQVENLVAIKYYLSSMYCHMRRKQQIYTPSQPRFQPLVGDAQRRKLVQWLSKICQKMGYKNQTLFTAVSFMDRFLALNKLPVNSLALLGSTVIYMATKIQEIRIPKVDTIVYISASPIVTKKTVLHLQSTLVALLQFNLTYCSPLQFIELYCLIEGLSKQIMDQSLKVAKQTLVHGQLKRYRASVIGLCSILFSLNQDIELMQQQLSLKILDEEVNMCMKQMIKLLLLNHPRT